MSNDVNPATFKPWPMKRNKLANGSNGRKELDKEKIKQLYLSQPNYEWQEFCKANNFKSDPNKRTELGFNHWQKQWLIERMNEQDEAGMSIAISTRAKLMTRRAAHPADWFKRIDALKNITTYFINRVQTEMHHDQKNAELIEEGKVKKKSHLSPMGLTMIIQANKNLMEMEREAMLVTANTAPGMLNTPEDERKAKDEDQAFLEEYQKAPIQIMGLGQVPREELTAAMSQWYDQQPEQHPDIPTTGVIVNEDKEDEE